MTQKALKGRSLGFHTVFTQTSLCQGLVPDHDHLVAESFAFLQGRT